MTLRAKHLTFCKCHSEFLLWPRSRHVHHVLCLDETIECFLESGNLFASPYAELYSINVTPYAPSKNLDHMQMTRRENSFIHTTHPLHHLYVLQNLLLELPLDLLTLLVGVGLAVEVKESTKVELW